MAVGFSNTNKPINPRGNDQSPKGYNRAALFSGKALDFDGVNDIVTTTYTSGFTGAQEFTYCVYINADTNQQSQAIVHGDEKVGWGLQSLQVRTETNGIRFFAGTGSSSTSYVDSDPIEENKWCFVVGTHTPTENKVYINGVLNATATADNLTTAPKAVTIGAYPNVASRFNGEISSPRIFDVALTAAQVADLYNNPEKIVPTGVADSALKLWLPMQEGAGTTAYDGSGNGNHGTISGATWTHGIGAPVAQTAVIDWNKGTNKAQYSEEFDNAYWGLVDTQTPTANATTAPDGQTTAEKIVPSTNNNIHYIWNTSISLTGQNTISVFAKYNGYNIGIRPQGIGSGQAFANFDLQNGTILGSGGTSYEDSSITSFGDGWYRISMTMDNASTYGINYYAVNGTTATELPSFTADGTSGYYLWGAQANAGATLTPYVRTGATAQTSDVLLPQGLTTGRDITGVNLFENVRKQGALNLDGNSWAEVHDNASLEIPNTDDLSTELWFKRTETPTQDYTKWIDVGLEAQDDTNFSVGSILKTDEVFVEWRTSSSGWIFTDTDATFNKNEWTHLVITIEMTGANSSVKTYKNGVLNSTKAQSTTRGTGGALSIGKARWTTTRITKDAIAQPRIYNRALTAEEVLQNYNSGKNTYTND